MVGQFAWFDTLTDREKELVGLIITGHDNQQIAEKHNLEELAVSLRNRAGWRKQSPTTERIQKI
ncbi:LuxR C-terminal-related transcriptional regulator [Sphaerochaeta sp. PS]|nr:LuxR C-terminal-related transcriptional regulator [Sphaerochaeta sp. PS]MDT4762147.1 LuxR C-terminal-related transcriptional regulator [Sphaerochaeta sp. PS]